METEDEWTSQRLSWDTCSRHASLWFCVIGVVATWWSTLYLDQRPCHLSQTRKKRGIGRRSFVWRGSVCLGWCCRPLSAFWFGPHASHADHDYTPPCLPPLITSPFLSSRNRSRQAAAAAASVLASFPAKRKPPRRRSSFCLLMVFVHPCRRLTGFRGKGETNCGVGVPLSVRLGSLFFFSSCWTRKVAVCRSGGT
jgi:hypothetical protein